MTINFDKVNLIDVASGKEINGTITVSADRPITCDIVAGGEEIGSMLLQVGKRDVAVILLKNKKLDKIKHVGKELMNYAEHFSKEKGLKGRLSVFATQNSHSFYYLLGFRSVSEEKNKAIFTAIQEAKGSKADTRKLGGVPMFNYKF